MRKIVPAATATALLWAACCAALVWRSGFPDPRVHDEFSYLLGADTFAHGRLANPPHPLARFFESPHILVRPKYASKYPPGQALVLALGEKLFGAPYYGVLISGAVMMFLLTMTLIAWTSLLPGVAVSAVLGLVFLPRPEARQCCWPLNYTGEIVRSRPASPSAWELSRSSSHGLMRAALLPWLPLRSAVSSWFASAGGERPLPACGCFFVPRYPSSPPVCFGLDGTTPRLPEILSGYPTWCTIRSTIPPPCSGFSRFVPSPAMALPGWRPSMAGMARNSEYTGMRRPSGITG
jgi:hypothetical protein